MAKRIAQWAPLICIDLDTGEIGVQFQDSFQMIVDERGNMIADNEDPEIVEKATRLFDTIIGEGDAYSRLRKLADHWETERAKGQGWQG